MQSKQYFIVRVRRTFPSPGTFSTSVHRNKIQIRVEYQTPRQVKSFVVKKEREIFFDDRRLNTGGHEFVITDWLTQQEFVLLPSVIMTTLQLQYPALRAVTEELDDQYSNSSSSRCSKLMECTLIECSAMNYSWDPPSVRPFDSLARGSPLRFVVPVFPGMLAAIFVHSLSFSRSGDGRRVQSRSVTN